MSRARTSRTVSAVSLGSEAPSVSAGSAEAVPSHVELADALKAHIDTLGNHLDLTAAKGKIDKAVVLIERALASS